MTHRLMTCLVVLAGSLWLLACNQPTTSTDGNPPESPTGLRRAEMRTLAAEPSPMDMPLWYRELWETRPELPFEIPENSTTVKGYW